MRLDGHAGTGAVLADLAGLRDVIGGNDTPILKRAEIQACRKLPADQHQAHPESGRVRTLDDGPDLALGPEGVPCRVIVATPSAGKGRRRIGVTRSGVVSERFLTKLPQRAFPAADVVARSASRRV